MVEWLDWEMKSCYGLSWKHAIVPQAFSHPAKMARGQLRRLLRYLLDCGEIAPGAVILDPFGGIGSTAIEGARVGLRVLCVELEPKFVALAERNFDLHRTGWERRGCKPRIVQGDSRRLVEVVGPVLAECAVSSPPFVGSLGSTDKEFRAVGLGEKAGVWAQNRSAESVARLTADYGDAPGQLGAMKPGAVDTVVTSQPYAESSVTEECGQLGTQERNLNGHPAAQTKKGYGGSAGQLGALSAGAIDTVVTSPPFQGEHGGAADASSMKNMDRPGRAILANGYGESDGQMGNTPGETFWGAAKQVVQQTVLLLKPGAVTAWVVKDFVRAKARQPFCDDWCKLLEACGLVVETRIRCHLTEERRSTDLFGTETVTKKERKSFFRRLAESKGSPRIDHEEIVLARKPRCEARAPAGLADCAVSSPPYSGNEKSDYLMSEDGKTRARDEKRGFRHGLGCYRGSESAYGTTAGQIGALASGAVTDIMENPQ